MLVVGMNMMGTVTVEDIHPLTPQAQVVGYQEMFKYLGDPLCDITTFDSLSLQPNVGVARE